jgi:hypothetical protein
LLAVGLSPNLPSPGGMGSTNLFAAGSQNAHALGALVSQHRLLELSRFGLRGYDLAQHMLTQQGAVSKLLGKCKYKKDLY